MENQTMVTKLLGEAMDSEGLAADRYAIYLDGLEATQNRSTAAWEGMWQATIESGAVKWFYRLSAAMADSITRAGGLDGVLKGLVPSFSYVIEAIQSGVDMFNQWMDASHEAVYGELRDTIATLRESAVSWDEYRESLMEVAEAEGYLVDETGRLYRETMTGTGLNKVYVDGLEEVTRSMFEAGIATDGWANGLQDLGQEIEEVDKKTYLLADNFQAFINSTEELSGGDSGIRSMMDEFSMMNEMFREGILSTDEYFEQLEAGIDNLDMTEMFGDNQEAALTFFEGLSVNAVQAISTINAEWENGSVSFTTYLENLSGASEMMLELGEMAAGFFGDTELAGQSMSILSNATDELNQRLEVNIATRDLMRQVVQQELDFGTTAYNEAMKRQSEVMAVSGITYTNVNGMALKSANEIYDNLVAVDGNFQRLSSQTANQTQNTMKNAAVGVSKLLNGIADAIDSFRAQINFTPTVDWSSASIDILGQKMSLPTVTFDVSGSGVGGLLRSAASQLESWNPEPIDASVYTQGAGGTPFEGASSDYEALADTVGSVTHEVIEMEKAAEKAAKALEKDVKTIDDLLDMVVKKIKQEQKARKEALKDQLSDYKDIIDIRKKMLKTMDEEEKYQRKLRSNQRELGNVQSEIEELRLDDSEEAMARTRALEEEAATIKLEIDEDAYDKSIDMQEDALDKDYDNFKRYIDTQIGEIDNYLAKPGAIVSDALSMIENQGIGLYESLVNWNSAYGSGIKNDVVAAWNEANAAIAEHGGLLSSITGNSTSVAFGGGSTPSSPYGGMSDYGAGGGMDITSMSQQAPQMESTGGTSFSLGKLLDINVSGNLDSTVMPEIEAIMNGVVDKLNRALRTRGTIRNANQFQI